jgi:lipopolysaccharide biosynthesis protein
VENVIKTFWSNPRLGIIVPFTIGGGIQFVFANEWMSNYDNARVILREKFCIEEDYLDPHPIAPFGGMFWARSKALETLTSYNWQYEDFPEEPLRNSDGLVMHALERLVSRLAQNDGFYTSFVAPDKYASNYIGYHYYVNKEMKIRLFSKMGMYSDADLLKGMENLQNEGGNFSYWKNHKIKLELKYLYFKLMRLITVGRTRQRYKTNLHKIKAMRRVLKIIERTA